jgi:hypothetical protein
MALAAQRFKGWSNVCVDWPEKMKKPSSIDLQDDARRSKSASDLPATMQDWDFMGYEQPSHMGAG